MNKDNVIVLGNGFLGSCFARHGYDVWNREKFSMFDRDYHTMYNMHKLNAVLRDARDKPEQLVIINTIGISDTRFCEDDANWDLINNVNTEIPRMLSGMCDHYKAKFVHISTGCLYDVRNELQTETDFISAHCNYVLTKWAAEKWCNPDQDLIIRPRLLFDSEAPAKGKRNNLLCKFGEFSTFLKEYNTVTSNDTIVEAIEALLENDQVGVFNVGNEGIYTIADMAEYLGFDVKGTICQADLHASQKLYLVNNIMDLSKLKQYYEPRDIITELKRCKAILDASAWMTKD